MRYRRANVPWATYFFTVNLAERHTGLLVEHIDSLRGAMRRVKRAHPFRIDAMVVLPDHLHALWTMPRDDADFARVLGFAGSPQPTETPVGMTWPKCATMDAPN